jgi:hypothetical protein
MRLALLVLIAAPALSRAQMTAASVEQNAEGTKPPAVLVTAFDGLGC